MLLLLASILASCFLESPNISAQDKLNEPGAPEGRYKGFGFEWENNDLGISNGVPAPWTPIKIEDNVLSIWGRKYSFSNTSLPKSITAEGRELLYKPMKLEMSANGKSISDDMVCTFVQKSGDLVVRTGKNEGRDITVTADVQIAYDGFTTFEFSLEPTHKEVTLEKMRVEIPFNREIARYYSHYLYYDYTTKDINRRELINSAGKIDREINRAFTNHFWVGNQQVGVELGFETNWKWSLADPNKAIVLKPEGSAVVLQINIIDKPVKINEKMIVYFSMLPNPFKPMQKDWRTYVISDIKERPAGYDRKLWRFATMRVGPNFFIPLRYVSLSVPPNPELEDATDKSQECHGQFARLSPLQRRQLYDRIRKTLADNDIRYVPYSALLSIDLRIPEVEKYAKWWLRNTAPDREKPGKGTRETLSLYSKSVKDFLVWHFVKMAREQNETALYFDWASTGKPVINPNAARFHVVNEGASYKPIFSVYDFHKRLYKAMRELNPDYLITQHHSKMPLTFGLYTDLIYSGEAMTVLFMHEGRLKKSAGVLPKDCPDPPYWPDYSQIPDDFWMAVYHQGFGFSNIFLPYLFMEWNKGWIENNPDLSARFTRILFSRILPLDVPVIRGRLCWKTFDKVMLGFQEYFGGLVDPIEFTGPDDADKFLVNHASSKLMAGAYARPDGRVVLALSNWTKSDISETIVLNAKYLGLKDCTVRNLIDMETGELIEHTGSSFKIDVPANDYRLIAINAKEGLEK